MKMLRQALLLTSQRDYAQLMRAGLLALGDDEQFRLAVELDALRAMQLVPQLYDLIVLDAMLDSMDGVQLLLLMKQQAPSTIFVVVSDVADETARAQAYRNGADFFLERPHTFEEVKVAVEAIRHLLDRHLELQPPRDNFAGEPVCIADVVQTRCLSGDSVLLLVRSSLRSGDIFIYRGEVYHAQFPGLSGEVAFHEIMHWDDGLLRVNVRPLSHVPPRTIEVPYRQLLAAVAESSGLGDPSVQPHLGALPSVSDEIFTPETVPSVVLEAPPLTDLETSALASLGSPQTGLPVGETPLPPVNSHWKINLMGELVEGSQVSEASRCAFITYFIFRKLADVAVTLEVDYFNELTLYGPHLNQVLLADNLGVRHAVFETAWTKESDRQQYVEWSREQGI